MEQLIKYIIDHTERGECQCGKCVDKGEDREAPAHSVSVHFFWVSAKNNPTKEELTRLLIAEYPDLDRLPQGLSYIEMGATLGSQELAFLLMGLGSLVGLWTVITPEKFGVTGAEADEFAGNGFVLCSGFDRQIVTENKDVG